MRKTGPLNNFADYCIALVKFGWLPQFFTNDDVDILPKSYPCILVETAEELEFIYPSDFKSQSWGAPLTEKQKEILKEYDREMDVVIQEYIKEKRERNFRQLEKITR